MRVVGLAGWSGAGKTTLLTRLIPYLTKRGLRVSTIKHAHHDFEIDQPGKDSWLHREAGAHEVLVSSARRFAIMHELRSAAEPALPELLARLERVDLVIVEGFKRAAYRKIEIAREVIGKPLIYPNDDTVVGIAADPLIDVPLPVVHLGDIAGVAEMMLTAATPLDGL